MHYQNKPYQEDKIVSCLQGKVYDVIVDIRPILLHLVNGLYNSVFEKMIHYIFPKVLLMDIRHFVIIVKCYIYIQKFIIKIVRMVLNILLYLDIKWPLKTTNISIRDSELEFFWKKK